jgi:hypothetical protein
MDLKLEKKLLDDFPEMYRKRHWPKEETCLCWGFDVGDGWYKIIYDLSKKINKLLPEMNSFLAKEGLENFAVEQVKEKFGTLRFYVNYSNDKIEKLINAAELKSAKTCMECGKPGKLQKNLWLHVYCNKCQKAYIADKGKD